MEYRERVTATPLFRWFVRLLGLIPLFIGLLIILFEDEQAFIGGITLVLMLVVVICIERWFMLLDVTVRRGEVEAAFGPIRKHLKATAIASVAAEPYEWMLYGGWGIRWGRQKRRAWTVPFLKTGIVLAMVDGTRYYISSHAPDRLRAAVQAMLDEASPDTGTATGRISG